MRYIFIFIITCLAACEPSGYETGKVEGYVPVYASAQASTMINVEAPKPTASAGKIYAYNQFLFQVEQGKGIHIMDNSDPQQAEKISFLSIPLCSELAIKSNFLYTNNLDDLLVFNISNIQSPQLVSRMEGAFPNEGQQYPPMSNVYFECVDPSKGIVIGWEKKIIDNPKCRR